MGDIENLNYTIYSLLTKGMNPAKIKKKLNIKSMSVISYHLKKLKSAGLIEPLGLGVWEVSKVLTYKSAMEIFSVKTSQQKKVRPSGQVQIKKSDQADKFKLKLQPPLKMGELPPNTQRGHGYRFRLQIPHNSQWKNKRKILKNKDIKIKDIGHNWLGEQFLISDRFMVQLTTSSISIIFPKDFSIFHDNPYMCHAKAVSILKQKIKEIERILGFSLKLRNRYYFRPTQSHYALIKNALAKLYNKKHIGMKIYDEDGLWLIIDDSFNFNELECIRVDTNLQETTNMQDIMNSYNRLPLTSEMTIKLISENARQLGYFGEQMVSHVDAVKKISSTLDELKEFLKDNYRR